MSLGTMQKRAYTVKTTFIILLAGISFVIVTSGCETTTSEPYSLTGQDAAEEAAAEHIEMNDPYYPQ